LDDRDAVRDIDDDEEDEGEGEDLFANNVEEYVSKKPVPLRTSLILVNLKTEIMHQTSYWITTRTGTSTMKESTKKYQQRLDEQLKQG
jgi:hypothetical protein